MISQTSLFEIRVASPCPMSWDAMKGDDRVRFCGQCSLNVYNLSALTEAEAQALVREKEGRLCVRFFQRADGTRITQDCPVGLAAVRRRIALVAAGFAAAIMGFAAFFRPAAPAMATSTPATGSGTATAVVSDPPVAALQDALHEIKGQVAEPMVESPLPNNGGIRELKGRIAMPPKHDKQPAPEQEPKKE